MYFAAGPALAPIIVPAVAVVAVGAIGAMASAGTTRRANENSRAITETQNAHALAMAREQHEREVDIRRHERVEQRRADVYRDLLIDTYRQRLLVRQIASAVRDGRDPKVPPPPDPFDPDYLALNARVAAFGSEQVEELWSKWVETFLGIVIASFDDGDATDTATEETVQLPTERDVKYSQACLALCGIVDDIERQIRQELQGDPAIRSEGGR